ncbi:predicted GPI-anchored protein 23 [Diachasma alloeum]|uniref:predicted GPI-anchored protein 23 n=1 Tax=Diachasma alloeum TaxID=454923 RepID=UPI0007384BE3|nr:predicted GPI-anchored protein 23 [Diachasma alloeum]
MKLSLVLCALVLLGFAGCSPIVKRETNEISPINEVLVLEEQGDAADDEHGDREKRKIGIVKLGVTNGIIGFVFGKLDSFLDAKTKALTVLDESNKAKNAIYGIDNTQSATGAFVSDILGKKVQAASAGIGPLINSATTFVSSAAQGIVGAVAQKVAPLSSIVGGLSGGSGSSGGSGGEGGGSAGGALSILTSLSGSSGSLSGGNNDDDIKPSGGAGAGINLGAFANLGGGGGIRTTTEEDIPEFDRNKVSLDVPPQAFGAGFTVITGISRAVGKIIQNSAKRTEQVFEVFKPLFRGVFAIKGLPSDRA